TSNLYDSLRPSEDPVNDAAEAQHVTYSLLVFKNSENKTRHHEPEEGAVYSEVQLELHENPMLPQLKQLFILK
ncbi:hypothetical protein GOODEAATRI_004879, partial [Goodea atripinnis]